jgi:hypothetical protein
MKAKLLGFAALLSFAVAGFAQSITGTVTNGTSGKPASGVEVTLLTLANGMQESGSTKTDTQGKYSLKLDGGQGPHLVRATHQGVNYFKMVPPGMSSGDLEVYDSSSKVDGVTGNVNVMRLQADSGTLQVMELFAVRNDSNPPRTLNKDATFEIVLPEGAQIDQADAASPNGQPLSVMPTQLSQKNHYGFSFALKPGETRFQVAYHLPYSGKADLAPKLSLPFQHFVVMVPPSMKLDLKNAALFSPMNDQGATVQVTNPVKPGENLAFTVSGTGTIQDQQQNASAQGGGAMGGGDTRQGPGGGLGRPIESPDALANYRWPLLGVLLIVLFGTAYLTISRSGSHPASTQTDEQPQLATAASVSAPGSVVSSAAPSGNTLLDAMKEELFQLEIERQQGQISVEEYEKQKAALDATLKRALSRAGKS